MHATLSLVRTRLRILRNLILDQRRDSVAKTAVVLLGLVLVVGIGFFVSYHSLLFIERFPAVGPQLNARLLGLLFMVLFTMVTLSTAIVAYTSLFLAKETGFFFQHPVPPTTIFFFKVFESIAFSGWATVLLCLPVLVAFGVVREAPATYYLESVITLLLFIAFCGTVGASSSVALLLLVRRWTARKLVTASLILLALVGWNFMQSFDFASFDGENNLRALNRFTMNLQALESPFFPSAWATAGILAAATGHHRETLFQAGLLLANGLIALPVMRLYASGPYGGAWLGLSEPRPFWRRRRSENADDASGEKERGRPVRLDSAGPQAALGSKDFLTLIRAPAQLSQFVLFVILTLVYILALTQIPSEVFSRGWVLTFHFANIAAICLILSSFTSRFIFPLISLEGRAFWIVGLAPLPRSYLVKQKVLFARYLILTLGVIATICSSLSLGLEIDFALSALYLVLICGWVLTALAVGLGAAYPNLNEDNPARIAVGLGGTLNFFTSALTVAALIFCEAVPYMVPPHRPSFQLRMGAHLIALCIALAISRFVLRLGERSMEAREF